MKKYTPRPDSSDGAMVDTFHFPSAEGDQVFSQFTIQSRELDRKYYCNLEYHRLPTKQSLLCL
jgi:hypothetical protein